MVVVGGGKGGGGCDVSSMQRLMIILAEISAV